MKVEVFDDAKAVAKKAAELIAGFARDDVVANNVFTMAVSGGHTPWIMLRELAGEKVPWEQVQLFQIDERIAPAGDPDRNLTHLRASLLDRVSSLNADHVHAMPVESADALAAARAYALTLERITGKPPVLDLAHLGLGPDGHTASLVPNDPVLNVTDADVAVTGVYMGRKRMTLTYPVLNRARRVIWVVTGAEKSAMLKRLLDGDQSIPAGRVNRDRAIIIADRAAAAA